MCYHFTLKKNAVKQVVNYPTTLQIVGTFMHTRLRNNNIDAFMGSSLFTHATNGRPKYLRRLCRMFFSFFFHNKRHIIIAQYMLLVSSTTLEHLQLHYFVGIRVYHVF